MNEDDEDGRVPLTLGRPEFAVFPTVLPGRTELDDGRVPTTRPPDGRVPFTLLPDIIPCEVDGRVYLPSLLLGRVPVAYLPEFPPTLGLLLPP